MGITMAIARECAALGGVGFALFLVSAHRPSAAGEGKDGANEGARNRGSDREDQGDLERGEQSRLSFDRLL